MKRPSKIQLQQRAIAIREVIVKCVPFKVSVQHPIATMLYREYYKEGYEACLKDMAHEAKKLEDEVSS